ncbi:hypothetical protein ACOME3_004417 [Neoechinorhynchus agilis]
MAPSLGYKYREFDIGNGIKVMVRCEIHGYVEPRFLAHIRALTEWDSRYSDGIDWKSNLDTRRGAVLATELKNNAFKFARWTATALLSNVDKLILGYVSRENPMDSTKHVIRAVQHLQPAQFARQINLNIDNGWGVLRFLVDFFLKDGKRPAKYIILRDPIKPVIKIYLVEEDEEDHDDAEKRTIENAN